MGPAFRHAHYEEIGEGMDASCYPIQEHMSILKVPTANPDQLTSISLHPNTSEGKRACQQIMTDLANFWLGEPVEYLALYVRDW